MGRFTGFWTNVYHFDITSISCALFQDVSNGISHTVMVKCQGRVNVNYLDDYLFVAYLRRECNRQLRTFLVVCKCQLRKHFGGQHY